jgi:cytochrome b pre-mRNA-processing protein 3
MFMHFSIMLIVFRKKKVKFNQTAYDKLFQNIENNLRELGFGDVSVNKKMKDFNKILYDILLKIDKNDNGNFNINQKLIFKYFEELNTKNRSKYQEFEQYFLKFYDFCFELTLKNMIREVINYRYGCT